MGRIEAVQDQLQLAVLGIAPTRHVARQIECQENLKTLGELYNGLVWPAIGERAPWSEAPSFGRSIFAYAPPSHQAAKEACLSKRPEALQAKGRIMTGIRRGERQGAERDVAPQNDDMERCGAH
jgi:cellulose biosynthesis protein BcsQ